MSENMEYCKASRIAPEGYTIFSPGEGGLYARGAIREGGNTRALGQVTKYGTICTIMYVLYCLLMMKQLSGAYY